MDEGVGEKREQQRRPHPQRRLEDLEQRDLVEHGNVILDEAFARPTEHGLYLLAFKDEALRSSLGNVLCMPPLLAGRHGLLSFGLPLGLAVGARRACSLAVLELLAALAAPRRLLVHAGHDQRMGTLLDAERHGAVLAQRWLVWICNGAIFHPRLAV